MSKLLDLLNQVLQETPAPLGFGAARRQEQRPTLVLVGQLPSGSKSPEISQLGLDAVIVPLSSNSPSKVKQTAKSAGDALWGVSTSALASQDIEVLKKAGCDFILVRPDDTLLEALVDKELGRILEISSAMKEEHQRMLEALPVDAFLLRPDDEVAPLTLRHLMDMLAIITYVDKPVLLLRTHPPSRGELEALRNAGIDGIVLELDNSTPEEIQQLREAIASLPSRRERPERGTALVPQLSRTQASQSHEEEEEEEPEEDF